MASGGSCCTTALHFRPPPFGTGNYRYPNADRKAKERVGKRTSMAKPSALGAGCASTSIQIVVFTSPVPLENQPDLGLGRATLVIRLSSDRLAEPAAAQG